MRFTCHIYALITPPNLSFASPEQKYIFNPSQPRLKYKMKIFIHTNSEKYLDHNCSKSDNYLHHSTRNGKHCLMCNYEFKNITTVIKNISKAEESRLTFHLLRKILVNFIHAQAVI